MNSISGQCLAALPSMEDVCSQQ